MRTTRRNSLARYRSIEGVRTSEIVYRGGHVKAKKCEEGRPASKRDSRITRIPRKNRHLPESFGKRRCCKSRAPLWFILVLSMRRKGRKKRGGGEGKKEEERRTRRRREFLAWWVLSIHDRRASCLFHGLTRVTKRHSF